jgi:hypothetical protein
MHKPGHLAVKAGNGTTGDEEGREQPEHHYCGRDPNELR